MKRLTSLGIGLAILISGGSMMNVAADIVDPHPLGNVIIGDDNGGKNLTYSTVSGVNFTVQERGAESSFVQAYLNMQERDWTGAEYVYLEVSNPFWGEVGVGISLVDFDGSLFRADVDWTDPAVSALPENAAKHNYWLMTSLADTNPTQNFLGWGAAFISPYFNGYLKLPISVFDYRWPVKGGADNSLDLSNISRIELDMDIYNNANLKLTWGNIYAGTDASKILAFDGSNVSKATGEELGSSYFVNYNGHESNMRDEVIKAYQFSTYQKYVINNQQWSPFYVMVPMDISMYNGISYYVDNTLEDKDVFFNKFIREWQDGSSGEQWYCDGGLAFYQPDDGEDYVGSANTIPAGFKGIITLPFSNFALPSWFTPINGVKDFDSVWWNFGFTFDVSQKTNKFIIKDFKLVADAYQFIRLAQNDTTIGNTKIVLPFEYYDTFDLASDWFTNWDKAVPTTVELVDSTNYADYGIGGKAMKLTVGKIKTVEGASHETALEHYPNTDAQKNINEAKGVTFFVKNPNNYQIGFNYGFDLLLANNAQQRWTTAIDARYMIFDLKTATEEVRNAKDGIYLPAGFEGIVRISFDQFVNPSWETNSALFNTTRPVAYMVINVNSMRHEGDSFIIDSFGYYYSDVEINTTFTTSVNSLAASYGIGR